MDAIISVICYKSKTLANGEHPLMLRIAQNGKSTYKSLKISVAAKHWDFDKNVPKPNNPHKDLIQKIILKTKLDYQQPLLAKYKLIYLLYLLKLEKLLQIKASDNLEQR